MGKTMRRTMKAQATKAQAKLAVAQVYWNNDQAYKQAEARRAHTHDLALVALSPGETVGPVQDDDGLDHWLTHGEKERVEMDAHDLWEQLTGMALRDFCALVRVDTALLKNIYPEVYAKMLKQRNTICTKHACLTWADKPRAARPRAATTTSRRKR